MAVIILNVDSWQRRDSFECDAANAKIIMGASQKHVTDCYFHVSSTSDKDRLHTPLQYTS
jgi:hypothetical protein